MNEKKINYWKEYFKTVNYAYMENWYDAMEDLTIKSVHFKLDHAEVKALANDMFPESGAFKGRSAPQSLIDKFYEARTKLKTPNVFARLGSRSPKDSEVESKKVDRLDSLWWIYIHSERIWEDIQLALMVGYEPHIFLREWVDMERGNEYRCFVKNGSLVGISQYYYREEFDHLKDADYRDGVMVAVMRLHKEIQKRIDIKDLVFDVLHYPDGNTVLLIEINPYSSWTEPCLFDWATDNFEEFEFRYVHSLKPPRESPDNLDEYMDILKEKGIDYEPKNI